MGLLFLLLSTITTFTFNTVESPYDETAYLILGNDLNVVTASLEDTLEGSAMVGNAMFLSAFFIGDWDTTDVYYQFSPTENDFQYLSQWTLLKHFGITAETQWELNVAIENVAYAPHIKIRIIPRSNATRDLKIRLCELF